MPFIVRKTITEIFLDRVNLSGDQVGFEFRADDVWQEFTYKEYFQECKLISFGLMGLGLKPKERAVILSNTRLEWSLADMAILGAGAVTVPIYASNTAEDVIYILNHCEAKIAFLEDARQLAKVLEKRKQNPAILPHLEKIVVLEASAMTLTMADPKSAPDVITLAALKEVGRREEARNPGKFIENLKSAQPEDLISICYTSGTTGVPKGVLLTQDNMVSVVEDAVAILGKFLNDEEVILSFLPFSHIFGKVESMLVYAFGWRQAFAENLDRLMTNMTEVKPTLLFAVPRIFEKAYVRIQEMVRTSAFLKKGLFEKSMAIGESHYRGVWAGEKTNLFRLATYELLKPVVFGKIADRFGGRLKYAVSGGAPLPKEIAEFFKVVGVQILEGYGLTETCAPVTLNTPNGYRFGTVGRPLPEVNIKIAEDGEILIKSRKVFRGYYKMAEETERSVQDGWLCTGDIGIIDDQGFLKITDRKKDLIVTSAGKNIAPQKIENLMKSQKMINQLMVYGDRRNYLVALITLDKDQTVHYANEHQILFSEFSELIRHPKILAFVQKQIEEVNHKLASFETIKKFMIIPHEFTVDQGEMTPSLKLKRNVIGKKYRTELDSLYEETPPRA